MDALKMLPMVNRLTRPDAEDGQGRAVSGSRARRTARSTSCRSSRRWPEDGGPFITLPLVFTKDPETGMRNIGTYRMQVFDGRTTGMHWQRHKGGAQHHRVAERLGKRLEVAVALGADPVLHVLRHRADARRARRADARRRSLRKRARRAGEVRHRRSRGAGAARTSCSRATSSRASAGAKGRSAITPGFYSHRRRLPGVPPHVHHACARSPIYLTTVVGIPPMEDYYLGMASERIFLPLIRKTLPEIVDMHFPAAGIFHNLVLVSIDKRYPGPRAQDHERVLGPRPADVLQDASSSSTRTSTCRTRRRSRGLSARTSIRRATSRSSRARSTTSTTPRSAGVRRQDGHRRDAQVAVRGLHARVAQAARDDRGAPRSKADGDLGEDQR